MGTEDSKVSILIIVLTTLGGAEMGVLRSRNPLGRFARMLVVSLATDHVFPPSALSAESLPFRRGLIRGTLQGS